MTDSAKAVFSDVHSNLEALQAVLKDMEAMGVRSHVCLGDIVGYAADPTACLELVRSLQCPVIQGNHDAAAVAEEDLQEMNASAQAGTDFARQQLSGEQRAWLAALPLVRTEEGAEFVHASLDAPEEWWYVIGPDDAQAHFQAQTRPLCFCGHTHSPMVWNWQASGRLSVHLGEGRIQLPAEGKTLINVGAVGQPRDRNPKACYVIFAPEARTVEFRRVAYDITKAKRKIIQAGLPGFTAQRLSQGR